MRFFAATLISSAALLVAAHFIWGKILPPPPEIDWVLELEKNKWSAAAEAAPPRILIVGGSEAHYGLSAETFARETGLPAFNLGTHAGLSWRTHYLNTIRLAESGDIVVFSVNYVRLLNDEPRDLEVRYWRERDPAAVFNFPLRQWPVFVGGDLIGETLESLGYPPGKGWLKRASNISPYGDETRNTVENQTQESYREIRRSGATPPYEGEAPGLERILELRDALNDKGARLYLVFPGQLDLNRYHRNKAYEGNSEALRALFESHGLMVLNRMDEAYLPVEMMYDTIYHPNSEGRARISAPAAKALARELKAEGVITQDIMESSS